MNLFIKTWLCCLSFTVLSAMVPGSPVPVAGSAAGVLSPANGTPRAPKMPKSSPKKLLTDLKRRAPLSPSGPKKILQRVEEKLGSPNSSCWRSVPAHLTNALDWLEELAGSPDKSKVCAELVAQAQFFATQKALGSPRAPCDLEAAEHESLASLPDTQEYGIVCRAAQMLPRQEVSLGIHSIVAVGHIKGDATGGGHLIADSASYSRLLDTTHAEKRSINTNCGTGVMVGCLRNPDLNGQLVVEEKTVFPYETLPLLDGTRFVTTPDHVVHWAQRLEEDGFIASCKVSGSEERILGSIKVPGNAAEITAEMVKKDGLCKTMYPIFSYVKLDEQPGSTVNFATFRDENGAEETLSIEKGEVEGLVSAALNNYEAKKASGGAKGAYNPLRYDLTHDIIVDIAPQLRASGFNTPVGRGIFVCVKKPVSSKP